MKLKTKIIILFTSCISFVLIGFLLLTRASIIKSTKNLTYNLNTQLIESKAEDAGSWLNQRISEIRIISQSNEIMNMDMDKIEPYINRLNDRLSCQYGNVYGTFAVGKTDGKGWVTDSQTIDVSQRDYFKEAMNTEEEYIISTPVSSHTDSTPIVLICYPVYNEEGNKKGFINGAISLNKISEIADSIDFYNCTSWIMDSQGNIYSSQKLNNITLDQLNDLRPEIKTTPTSDVGSYSIINHDKTENVVFYSSIPYTKDWYLCSMVSGKDLNKDLESLIYSICGIWLVMLLISLILCAMLSRSISRPVNDLTDAIKSMEDGNLNAYCEINYNDSEELINLGKSFNSMVCKIKFLMNRIYEEEQAKHSAELRVLQAQINPHFLYNTLDNLQWKAYDYDAIEIAEMIEALSNFFRISLSNGREFISLKDEFKHVENYLFIQGKRYEDILDFSIEYDSSLDHITVLKLIIQPVVENAIYHGIKPKLSLGKIYITAYEDCNVLFICVNDNGVGMDETTLKALNSSLNSNEPSTGYGLYNVNERIKLVYGDLYGLEIKSKPNEGTTVIIKIPVTTKEE